MNLGGSLGGALGGLLTGGPIGGILGGIGGLLGGGGASQMGGGLYSLMAPPVFIPPPVALTGPEFTGPALKLTRVSGVHSIQSLAVYPGNGSPMLQTLVPALCTLKNYLAPGASVVLYVQSIQVNAALLQRLSAAAGAPVTLPPDPFLPQMLAQQQQQQQNLVFEQQMNQQSQAFSTLSSAQQAMHNAIMGMLNNAK